MRVSRAFHEEAAENRGAGVSTPYVSRAWPEFGGFIEAASGVGCSGTEEGQGPQMADVVYVVLILATFGVFALVVKGVERLER